ncbi:P-loop containing nucleoside triphosphate hydrolase protein [Cercophora newfieldiana]|uniref:P-loop containing nucleoside triphosphate hydrolase protein n=1 Tax=Cercophora newfieldiana TaxID=92897 RepID=A0AA39YDY4_9PEZI|nr:P-loop containing nucleoside triphosphate hydrolase protein [Cercophora newfieldiana]
MESLNGPPLADSAMIVVMGPTGSGKSSFISLLSDEPVEISHRLHSHTISTRPYKLRDQFGGKNVFLVDTPGFDDTSRPDAEILKEISFFLVMLHEKGVRLAGIIYLHRISDPRMSGAATKNLRIFKSLCGEQNYRHVVLTSTMWSHDNEKKAVEKRRLEELQNLFWADMIRGGCLVKKHMGDAASALNIVRELATRKSLPRRPITLAIQRELGDEGRTLDDTAVGKLLAQEILGEREKTTRELAELQLSLEQAEQNNDQEAASSIRDEQEAASARAATRVRDIEGLGVRVSQLADEQRPRYHQTIADLLHEGQGDGEEGQVPPSLIRPSQNNSRHERKSAGSRRRPRATKYAVSPSKVALLTWIAKSYR